MKKLSTVTTVALGICVPLFASVALCAPTKPAVDDSIAVEGRGGDAQGSIERKASISPGALYAASQAAFDYLREPRGSETLASFEMRNGITANSQIGGLLAKLVTTGEDLQSDGVAITSKYFLGAIQASAGIAAQGGITMNSANGPEPKVEGVADNSAGASGGPNVSPASTPPSSGGGDTPKGKGNTAPVTATASPIDFFKSGNVSTTSKINLASAEILAGYSTIDKWTSVLSYKLTSSLPVGTPLATDYVGAELLERDGGVMNFYFSLPAQSSKNWPKEHPYDTDKWYFYQDVSSNDLLVYMRNGFGMKGYSTAIPKSGGSLSLDGIGEGYLGFGVDGPSTPVVGSTSGSISLDVGVSGSITNRSELDQLFNTTSARTAFGTWNAGLSLTLSNFTVKAFYAAAIGPGTRKFARDIAGVSVTLNTKSGSTPPPGNTDDSNLAPVGDSTK